MANTNKVILVVFVAGLATTTMVSPVAGISRDCNFLHASLHTYV